MASPKNVNVPVESWLKEKNLDQLVEQFKQRNITIEELCEFEEKDLKEFGIGFGLDTFDAARFAKYIVKNKEENTSRSIVMNDAVSRAVVITSDEETLLQKLENRRSAITSLINKADSSTTKKLNAKNQQIIEAKFAILIQQIEQKKQDILAQIIEAQQDKQSLIQENLIKLKQYLQNIQDISNNYNQWLIQNKINRNERKDKLSTLVQEECLKLLPQIVDVEIVYNNRLVTPFLSQICKIVNIGLFYPVISNLQIKQIASKSVTVGWSAVLTKEHLLYIEKDNLNMKHIMMRLQCKGIEEVKDTDNDDDDDIDMIHCIDYEMDEEEYEYRFSNLKAQSKYMVTLKCISMLQSSLISEHHQSDLNKGKQIECVFETVKYEEFVFRSDLKRVRITNDGKTACNGAIGNSTSTSNFDNFYSNYNERICCVILGDEHTLDNMNGTIFKLSFTVDTKADHIGFGFVTKDFASFEHSDWSFGGQCTFFYSDRDFKGCQPFQNKNDTRLSIQRGDTVHVLVNCKEWSAKIWIGVQQDAFCETSFTKDCYIAVALGARDGSSVTLANYQEIQDS